MKNIFEKDYKLWGMDLAIEEQNSKKNQLFPIYRKIALLLSSGISISDILLSMNIRKVKIYG